jgi:hypothetical protein
MNYYELSLIQKIILRIKSTFYIPKKGVMVCRNCGFASGETQGDINRFNPDRLTSANTWGRTNFCTNDSRHGILPRIIVHTVFAVYDCPVCGKEKNKTYSYYISLTKLRERRCSTS